ncbi:rhomboid family intramembrane serine protease [Marinicella sp. W31]|uniref:rhomboid family intramembrane serine protease n=1 Tax=Marinicella sp. W31 TaxID=3023713 RepID=UPI003757C5E3
MINFSNQKPKPFPWMSVLIGLLFTISIFLVELTDYKSLLFRELAIDTDQFFSRVTEHTVEFFRLILSLFLHGNWLHWGINTLVFFLLSFQLERTMGSNRFMLLFLLSGLAGNLAAIWFLQDTDSLLMGASGAVSGLIGAWLVVYPHKKISFIIPIGLYLQKASMPISLIIMMWFAVQLVLQFQTNAAYDIAWISHITGFAIGLILAWLLGKP